MANPEEMYQCQTINCGYIYNPDKGDRKEHRMAQHVEAEGGGPPPHPARRVGDRRQ